MSSSENEIEIGELFPVQYDAPRCFACGPKSETGIKLRFKKESKNSVSTRFQPPPDWTGWGDIMHGGFQSLLLDETMSWTAYGSLNVKTFVTKELQVQFIRPVHVNQPLSIIGYVENDDGKTIKTKGEIRGADNTLLTSARGVIVRVDAKVVMSSQVSNS